MDSSALLPPDISPAIPQERWRSVAVRLAPWAALFAVYFLVSCWQIQKQDLDSDEYTSSYTIRTSCAKLIANRLKNGHPPLYFLGLQAWCRVVRQTPARMFFFSALIGAATVGLTVGLGRELGLKRWAWAAGLFMALHPTLVFFARFIRPYGGVVALCCAILWLVLAHLRQPSRAKAGLLLAVGVTGALWNHVPAILWLSIAIGLCAIPALRRRTRADLAGAIAGALVAHGAILWVVVRRAGGTRPLAWVKLPTFAKTIDRFWELMGGLHVSIMIPGWLWIVPLAITAGLLYCFWLALGHFKGDRWRAAQWQLVLWATFFPFPILLTISLTLQPLIIARYLAFMLPGLILLPVWALSQLRFKRLAVLAMAALLITCVLSDLRMIRHQRNGMRQAVTHLEKLFDAAQGDKLLVFNSASYEALRLYSTKTYRAFKVYRRVPHDKGWRIFEKQTVGVRRLWVLDYTNAGSLLDSPQWGSRLGKPFYSHRFRRITLLGYYLNAQPSGQ